MCRIWQQPAPGLQKPELSLDDFSGILQNPLFSRLEFVNLNGGEPNLRGDLPEIADLLIGTLPRLKSLSMNSNGLPTERALSHVSRILTSCRKSNVRFSISISLHDLGDDQDRIVGVSGSYSRTLETLKALREIRRHIPFFLGINCVVSNMNLAHVDRLLDWGKREDIPINITLGEVRERFHNLDAEDIIHIPRTREATMINLFRNLSDPRVTPNQHALRYHELLRQITEDRPRRLACHYSLGGLILGSDGDLFYCKDSRSLGNCKEKSPFAIYYSPNNLSYRKHELLESKCLMCPPNTFNRIELEKDIWLYVAYLIKKRLGS